MYRRTRKWNKLVGERVRPSFISFKWVPAFIEVPLIKKLHISLMWSRNILPLCACIASQSNFTGGMLVRCCREGTFSEQLLRTTCIPRASLRVVPQGKEMSGNPLCLLLYTVCLPVSYSFPFWIWPLSAKFDGWKSPRYLSFHMFFGSRQLFKEEKLF